MKTVKNIPLKRLITADSMVMSSNMAKDASALVQNITQGDKTSQDVVNIFHKYSIKGSNDTVLHWYQLLHHAELQLNQWEETNAKVWKDRLTKLQTENKTPGGKAFEQHFFDTEITEAQQQLNKLKHAKETQRAQLYAAFFQNLHDYCNNDQDEIQKTLSDLQSFEFVKGRQSDKAFQEDAAKHVRIKNTFTIYKSKAKENVAYSNEWYLTALGALTTAFGIAFVVATVVTGLFAPYLIPFIMMIAYGLTMAWMGYGKSSQTTWIHRNTMAMEATMYTPEHMTQVNEYSKPHTSFLSSFNRYTIPFILMNVLVLGFIVADFYAGGSLSALGSAIKFTLLPQFAVTLPSNVGVGFLNGMTIISSSTLDMILIGMIGGAAMMIIDRLASMSEQPLFKRLHLSIKQSYSSVMAIYGLCSFVMLPFATPLIPMVILPLASVFLGFCMWKRFIKGEEKFVFESPGTPATMFTPAIPPTTISFSYNMGMVGTALVIGFCVLTAFALAANPITFGGMFIIAAVVIGLSYDHFMSTSAHEGRADAKQAINEDTKNRAGLKPGNSDLLKVVAQENAKLAVSPAPTNTSATNSSSPSSSTGAPLSFVARGNAARANPAPTQPQNKVK